jgi:Uma2 family endonuclease
MVAVREHFPRFTPEEYFEWEAQQQIRHEYIDGEVYAMTGRTINHSQISSNFNRLLGNHLRGSGCKTLNSDARVNIVGSTDYVYPDVSVTCDLLKAALRYRRDQTTAQYITHPCLIIEILSPSTEAYDRGDKFFMYRRSTSLQDYILVSAHKIAILVPFAKRLPAQRGYANDIFHKDVSGKWDITNYQSGDSIELISIDLIFPIEEVYEGITFEI